MVVKSSRQHISEIAERNEQRSSPVAKRVAALAKHSGAIFDTLSHVRAPIERQAAAEQRTDEWKDAAIKKRYASSLLELHRIQAEISGLRTAHAAMKPKPRASRVDRTDLVGALELLELAKKVAARPVQDLDKATPAERAAALAMPRLAGISESVANAWSDEFLASESPHALEAHRQDAETIREAKNAVQIAILELQRETGFLDEDGVPSSQWDAFQRNALKDAAPELEAVAISSQHDAIMDAAKAIPLSERIKFGGKILDLNTSELMA
jgi:hypothetical protein